MRIPKSVLMTQSSRQLWSDPGGGGGQGCTSVLSCGLPDRHNVGIHVGRRSQMIVCACAHDGDMVNAETYQYPDES